MAGTMKTLTKVLGFASNPQFADQLHDMEHRGKVEYLMLSPADALRKRLRATTDKGTEYTIAIPRDQKPSDGAILELSDHAIVVRMTEERWLTLQPTDAASALELGYFCGNLHWRVRFANECIQVALDGPEEDYIARLDHLISVRKARRITP
jgi:urease accessory protein